MSDLIERLRGLAERDTARSEFGPDEHIAGIAADEIERLTEECSDLKHALRCAYGDEGCSYDEAIRAVEALATGYKGDSS